MHDCKKREFRRGFRVEGSWTEAPSKPLQNEVLQARWVPRLLDLSSHGEKMNLGSAPAGIINGSCVQ